MVVIFAMATSIASVKAQPSDRSWNFRAVYSQEWVTGGYVKVREWDVEGDKMKLQDLGMISYPALQLQLDKTFLNKSHLSLSYENYLIKGNATINRNIEYNGTIINGNKGIDVAPTRFYRLRAHYHGNIYSVSDFHFRYIAGIVYDHTTFYLDGQVVPGSPRQEVYEQFGKQALPYPELGFSSSYTYQKINEFTLDVSGSYIPEFKSFYQEGGNMYLSYSTFLADANYCRKSGRWSMTGGFRFRYTHIFGESLEDTNDLKLTIVAPYLGLGISF